MMTTVILAILAFVAGFIDAVVGGGGLIQIPALLINFPNTPLATLFGTSKIAGVAGTGMAAYQFSKRIRFDYRLLLAVSLSAGLAAYFGAKVVSFIDANALKPIILVILIAIAIYTLLKKDLGSVATKNLPFQKQLIYGILIGVVVGFYDGFFGPGTGSFLVLGFVVLVGFDFLTASAYSKVINAMTNLTALIVFISHGNYLMPLALIMAVCNMSGSVVGSRLALTKGNGFIRLIFLFIVGIMILRYGYDVFA